MIRSAKKQVSAVSVILVVKISVIIINVFSSHCFWTYDTSADETFTEFYRALLPYGTGGAKTKKIKPLPVFTDDLDRFTDNLDLSSIFYWWPWPFTYFVSVTLTPGHSFWMTCWVSLVLNSRLRFARDSCLKWFSFVSWNIVLDKCSHRNLR